MDDFRAWQIIERPFKAEHGRLGGGAEHGKPLVWLQSMEDLVVAEHGTLEYCMGDLVLAVHGRPSDGETYKNTWRQSIEEGARQ
jgi:hypothetical protein